MLNFVNYIQKNIPILDPKPLASDDASACEIAELQVSAIKITFLEGVEKEYDIEVIRLIPALCNVEITNNSMEINAPADVFQVVLDLCLRNKNISDCLYQIDNPNILEEVQSLAQCLGFDITFGEITLTLDQARQVLKLTTNNTLLLQPAQETLKRSFYFLEEKEADQNINAIIYLKKENACLIKSVSLLEQELLRPKLNNFHKNAIISRIEMHRFLMEENNRRLAKLQTYSIMQYGYCIDKAYNSEDPLLLAESHVAELKIECYRKEILTALEKMSADVTRYDLLEHLIGPTNYLLDYYGIKFSEKNNCFELEEVGFCLTLHNLSPFALEREIRENCKGLILPKPQFEEEYVTFQLTPEQRGDRQYIISLSGRIGSITNAERELLCAKFIEIGKLDRAGVQNEDFRAFEMSLDSEIPYIKSIVNIFSHQNKVWSLAIFLNLNNLTFYTNTKFQSESITEAITLQKKHFANLCNYALHR